MCVFLDRCFVRCCINTLLYLFQRTINGRTLWSLCGSLKKLINVTMKTNNVRNLITHIFLMSVPCRVHFGKSCGLQAFSIGRSIIHGFQKQQSARKWWGSGTSDYTFMYIAVLCIDDKSKCRNQLKGISLHKLVWRRMTYLIICKC